ncbi:hypothetical protein [Catenuloplanes indicus]|uniref:Uncharacterized protein n=1 Tax=Catenuloplanes indicus TaxID=137267 RepID=A0AAE3W969_9ACTN|nr:hypothetical protein [Catenuloplanes indicus]MDQ0371592.1 hypothetical protein [Catenuloplanes indicus]
MPDLAHLLDRIRRHADGDGRVTSKICITGPEATALLVAYDRAQAVAVAAADFDGDKPDEDVNELYQDFRSALDAWREAMA